MSTSDGRRGKLGCYGKVLCLLRRLAVAAELASASVICLGVPYRLAIMQKRLDRHPES